MYDNNNLHGFGRVIFPFGGAYYIGQYENGLRHGKGKYVYESGAYYIGQFENGLRHKKGKYVFASGKIKEGQWKNDAF